VSGFLVKSLFAVSTIAQALVGEFAIRFLSNLVQESIVSYPKIT